MVELILAFLITIVVSFCVGGLWGWSIGRMERRVLRRRISKLEVGGK